MRRRDLEVIRTARLTLRPPEKNDLTAIVNGVGNYDVARWLASVPYPYRSADATAFIAEARARPGRTWVIDDGQGACGTIGLDPDLGYWLARPVWGRGYATEAGDAVVDAWFEGPDAGALNASHMAENRASAEVLAKLGFEDRGPRMIHSVALDQCVAGRSLSLTRDRWTERRRYRLSTRRLRLRELRPDDTGRLARIVDDLRIVAMLASVGLPGRCGRHALLAAMYRGRPGFGAAICTRMRRPIGAIFFGLRPDGVAGCAWFLDPAYRGRGLMTEAAGAFLADVMDRFGVTRIAIDDRATHSGSAATMHRLGFESVEAGPPRPRTLEPAPVVIYRLERSNRKAVP